MNGLDKIIKGIELEAKQEADHIESEAQMTAERLLADAKAAAKETEALAQQSAELEYKRIVARAESAGGIETNRIMLREKQRLISDTINAARNEILNSDNEEYFGFLIKLLEKYATGDQGDLILSAADKARMTKEFKAAAEGKSLAISDRDGEFDGGFVLVYGEIEENCTLDALMASESDALHDAVSAILF